MSEQQDGVRFVATRKVDLKVVSECLSRMKLRAASNRFEGSRQKCAHTVGGGLVIAGRLDLDERADGLNKCIAPRFEILQPLVPHAVDLLGAVACFPFHRHEAAFRPFVTIAGHKPYSIILTLFGTNDLWNKHVWNEL